MDFEIPFRDLGLFAEFISHFIEFFGYIMLYCMLMHCLKMDKLG